MKNNGGYLINQIQKISSRKFNELLKEKNIDEFNGSQGVILYSLWNNKELTIKEIGKITGLAKTSLTSMLDRMEEKGLIRKLERTIKQEFKRVTYKECIEILQKAERDWEFKPAYGADIAKEHEKYLTEYFGCPIFITK